MLIDKLAVRVKALRLNLSGKTVLTEAASGAYVVTPVIAALAGAKVFAFCKDTSYGKTADIFKETRTLIESYIEKKLDIELIDTLTPEIISQADIITNSGHLRPLNEDKLKYAKKNVVIPLMYEAWEWRDSDMDINYIRKQGIKIAATNERHPEVDVFNYLGDMALKLIFDAGITPYKNKFLLICNNDFGPFIAKVLSKNCEMLGIIDKNENKEKYELGNAVWIGNFPDFEIPKIFHDTEAIIFTGYPFDKIWIGQNTPISAENISQSIKHPYLLRYAGDIDASFLTQQGIDFYPRSVRSGHMGILPSAIGYDPIIRLQAGGLKAGEALLTSNYFLNEIQIAELL